MLDAHLRNIIDPPLNRIGKYLCSYNISANQITILGFCFGMAAAYFVGLQHYYLAAILIILNRILDGIDGAIARNTQLTNLGGFVDIVCDFIVYSAIVFASGIAQPQAWPYVAFLIFSFIGTITSFLAYAIIAAKLQHTSIRNKNKSFYYLGGICEGTETALVLLLLCLLPQHIVLICIVYGILCWFTTLGRIYAAWHDFS